MQTVIKANNSEHYLLCNYRFVEKTIETMEADVKRFMSDREMDDNYFRFINWQKKDNEIVVLTMYAYDDIDLPKKFDVIFQVDKPSNFIDLNFTITQAVINGWTPLNKISKGHKRICIIEFDKEIPDIFDSVSLFKRRKIYKRVFNLVFVAGQILEALKQKETSSDTKPHAKIYY